MDTTDLAQRLRSLATTPSRRCVARALTGFALAGLLVPLFDLTETVAKKNNKKKRRRRKRQKKNQPFCAGKTVAPMEMPFAATGLSIRASAS